MGRGKEWTPTESLHLAESWVARSEGIGMDRVLGTNQTEEQFWNGVRQIMSTKAPTPLPDGTYHQREWSALKNHWRDNVSREVKKFRRSLLKVYSRKLSGCSDQDKINIAVVLHRGVSDVPDYRYITYDPHQWKFYECWQYLKSHPAFAFEPPPPPIDSGIRSSATHVSTTSTAVSTSLPGAGPAAGSNQESTQGVMLSATASNTGGSVASFDTEDDCIIEMLNPNDGDATRIGIGSSRRASPVLFTPKSSSGSAVFGSYSRGPGPGAKKTKSNAAEEEYRKKKIKFNDDFIRSMNARQESYNRFIQMQDRSHLFRDAALGYKLFKDSDPEEAAKYKKKMERYMNNDDGLATEIRGDMTGANETVASETVANETIPNESNETHFNQDQQI